MMFLSLVITAEERVSGRIEKLARTDFIPRRIDQPKKDGSRKDWKLRKHGLFFGRGSDYNRHEPQEGENNKREGGN